METILQWLGILLFWVAVLWFFKMYLQKKRRKWESAVLLFFVFFTGICWILWGITRNF